MRCDDTLDLLGNFLGRAMTVNPVVIRAPVVFDERPAEPLISLQALAHHLFAVVVSLDQSLAIHVAPAVMGRPLEDQVVDPAACRAVTPRREPRYQHRNR